MEEFLRLYSRLTNRRGKSLQAERSLLRLYFINPFSAGIFGFAVFFFFEILFLVGADFLGFIPALRINLSQVAIAGIGFLLQFILELLKNFQ